MSILQADCIDFRYPEKPLFSQASLQACSGSMTGLLGPNGAGKTTFFDILCGLKKPDNGQITNPFTQQLYLSQTLMTPPALRMYDIFKMTALLCSPAPINKCHIQEKLARWSPRILDRYNEIWSKKSSLCSYGEKRWFFTVSLLSIAADFYILDEPTAGVDPEFRFHIWQCLRGAAQDGAAILVSSHNVDEISENCQGFYMISQQKFLHFEDGEAFKYHYQASTLDQAFIKAACGADMHKSSQPIRP
ncbi:AAA family ATPase [Pseudomonas fluorescens]|uniref:Lipopolysaccharide export system ATP-binding protein LptB n=1 Tax=Pseudomonas fluorescens TaxID=294 RepID=A0A5E6YBN7_PSEFL|nr:AAA family ATPase [Pseudomonas fluorescens]VVN50274.1 Lipopolysaccharide export system ATP-binding protein LptB [Pseudomonas fluorescens]